MSRLLEFHRSPTDVLITRVLVQINQAIDDQLPGAAPVSGRFARSVFREDEGTGPGRDPDSMAAQAGENSDTFNSRDTDPGPDPDPTDVGFRFDRRSRTIRLLLSILILILGILGILFSFPPPE